MKLANKSSGNVLFWVLAPALFPLLVAPLAMGHVIVRLMIARMHRWPGRLRGAQPDRTATALRVRAGLRALTDSDDRAAA